jgi:pimeloyl-ACP methyl ester carboxylesterase
MGAFITAVCGEGGSDDHERLVPGATAEALNHAAGFFAFELPAVVAYAITAEDVAGIEAPVLNMSGTESAPRFADAAAIVQAWFPRATRRDVPAATHLLPAQRPGVVAAELVTFWQRISS